MITKKRKYNNTKCEYNGLKFDSKKEMRRYIELSSDPAVTNLRCQVTFELIPKVDRQRAINYIADFVYDKDGEEVVEDVKGLITDVFKIKAKLFYYRYHKSIHIV